MKRKLFVALAKEVPSYTCKEAYASDMARSAVWGDDLGAEIPAERLEQLGMVWDAVNRPVSEIVKSTGLSQAAFAKLHLIPLRTLENWCTGSRECRLYDRIFLQEAVGLLHLEN